MAPSSRHPQRAVSAALEFAILKAASISLVYDGRG
jgi:hypothetical protein